MKNKITVSAPGKLMLFGEHAVVYGRPSIVTAVDQRMFVTITTLPDPVFQLEAPDVAITGYSKPLSELGQGEIPKGAKFVEIAVANFLRHPELVSGSKKEILNQVQNDELGFRVETRSEFSSQFGFGSSSASTACVIKALSEITGINLSEKKIFDLAYKTVLDIQGKGSGFDIAAAIYGGTIYFVTGGKVIEPLNTTNLPLIIGYTGIKADTITLVDQVAERFKDNQKRLNLIYDKIGQIANQAKVEFEKSNFEEIGRLMNKNQKLLVELGVSIAKLDIMNEAAIKAGAFGAKLSGGGGGDCMVALGPDAKVEAIKAAITAFGGQIMPVKTNAEGVRIENVWK